MSKIMKLSFEVFEDGSRHENKDGWGYAGGYRFDGAGDRDGWGYGDGSVPVVCGYKYGIGSGCRYGFGAENGWGSSPG